MAPPLKSLADLLDEHPVFHGLDRPDLEFIAGCGHNVHASTGERLLTEGTPADHFYLVRKGKVAVEINVPNRGPVVIETLGPGDLLGISWLLPPYRNTFDARALDSTSAIQIDAACLRNKCDDDPRLGYALYKRFAGLLRERLQATRLQLLDVYGDTRRSPSAPVAEVAG